MYDAAYRRFGEIYFFRLPWSCRQDVTLKFRYVQEDTALHQGAISFTISVSASVKMGDWIWHPDKTKGEVKNHWAGPDSIIALNSLSTVLTWRPQELTLAMLVCVLNYSYEGRTVYCGAGFRNLSIRVKLAILTHTLEQLGGHQGPSVWAFF